MAVGHIGVVGAGLAGLATALAAAQAGIRVELFEARSEPAFGFAHVDVVPNLLRSLVALGLGDACVRRGFPYSGIDIVDSDGHRHDELPTPRLAGRQWPSALGMAYGELLEVLRQAVLKNGVRMHGTTRVVDVREGHVIVTGGGARHPVDLAVVASGSLLPLLDGSPARPVQLDVLPLQCCYALLPRPHALNRASWIIGKGSLRALQVPVDHRRAGVAVIKAGDGPMDHASIRDALGEQGPLLQEVAAYWPDDSRWVQRPVSSGVLAGPWHELGVLRVGSSAHPLVPYFGQAAAQSAEDAVVLGELLRNKSDRTALLSAFTARRVDRVQRVHALTAQAARWQLRPEAQTDLRALAEQLAPLVAEPA
jgi:2-polyprenyl-6-methoxyphenol hydroxylase-like FAD-dependent oxidoreductase